MLMANSDINRWGGRVKNILTILVLVFIAYIIYPFVVGDEKMQIFCDNLQAGESKKYVLAQALKSGYTSREMEDNGQLLIIDSKAMGRYICEVTMANNRVVDRKYVFND